MKPESPFSTVPEEVIISKIYLIRDQKIMLDRDLAFLYGVSTKVLNQAVRRNIRRFPEDFMFQMKPGEFNIWRSQIVTSKSERMGIRRPPHCFTEQGVAMLSSVLNSEQAIEANIRIIRIFTRMRQMLVTHKDILLKLEQFEKQMDRNTSDIQLIFQALKQLLTTQEEPRKRIGYRRPSEQ
ncbi:MAG TPA: ORF6N domain-containing protein [Bacteroidales bacterium]|nr:ORF6N domain-containing protein [Bacteroidales bacterium]